MPWYRLAFRPQAMTDLEGVEQPTAQRLFDKTKWIASNVDNLRHQPIEPDFPTLYKYAVGQWRIFYSIDLVHRVVDIHHIAQRRPV